MIAGLSVFAPLAVAAATVASFSRDWRLALIAHFRPHLAAAAVLAALAVTVVDLSPAFKLVLIAVALATAVANLREIRRVRCGDAHGVGSKRLRLAFANLLKGNLDSQRLIDWVRQEKVDVLVVAEVERHWPSRLAALGDVLPFAATVATGDVAIYSRHEIAGEPHHIFPHVGHAVAVKIRGITVIGLHTASPESARRSEACDELIDSVGTYVGNLAGPVVVVGDFNATPWCRPVQRLVGRTGLAYGPGARIGTFPAELRGWKFATWLGIPIDLVLAGRGAAVARRHHGPRIGSDHWPVIAEIAYEARGDSRPDSKSAPVSANSALNAGDEGPASSHSA